MAVLNGTKMNYHSLCSLGPFLIFNLWILTPLSLIITVYNYQIDKFIFGLDRERRSLIDE